MNFLTHLYLADHHQFSLEGSILPDLCKPNEWRNRSPFIIEGCLMHQQVDRLTDSHPEFLKLKKTVSPARKRFAGIILDVAFDHILANNWQDWHEQPLSEFSKTCYQKFSENQHLQSERTKEILQAMHKGNWLASYKSVEGIARAFKGMSRRFRFENPLTHSEQELLNNFDEWQYSFNIILKDLRKTDFRR